MNDFDRLIEKSANESCRLKMRFAPEIHGEQWGIKYYPEPDDDAYFYAFHEDLNCAARKLLDELQGFDKW